MVLHEILVVSLGCGLQNNLVILLLVYNWLLVGLIFPKLRKLSQVIHLAEYVIRYLDLEKDTC